MGWQLIQSYNVGDGITSAPATSITFSSIPQTYKSLKLLASGRSEYNGGTWENIYLKLNGVTTNVSERYLYGTGSAVGTNTAAEPNAFWISRSDTTVNTFGNAEVTIPNYASTTTNKAWSSDSVMENNATASFNAIVAGLWSSTAAVTSITLESQASYKFVFGSTFQLYGLI